MRNFLAALTLLTRLGPAHPPDSARIRASVLWYPAVGALIGLLCLLPYLAGLARDLPWVQAWLYIGVSLWLTRALHWDGLADLADALGSGADGEAFRRILKDSRTGVFGALTLCFCLLGTLIAAHAHFAAQNIAPLFLAPLNGRCMCVLLAASGTSYSPDSIAAPVIAGARAREALASGGILLASLLLGAKSLLLLTALGLAFLRFHSLGRRRGGLSGDFLGAAVVSTELLTLIVLLL